MTSILGISAFYHDSAAALVIDGKIVAAAQEERYSRIKHDAAFPSRAIADCLAMAGLSPSQIDFVGYYEKPLLKFERLLENHLAVAPRGLSSFCQAMPIWLKRKLHLRREFKRSLPGYRNRYTFCEHHQSHAASAFFPSPFDKAAILTLDGVGEWATATRGIGTGNRIEISSELRYPHSLGLLYSAFTYHCGFRVNSGEYKLMGLAPFGEPEFVEQILDQVIDLRDDGSFHLDLSFFDYRHGLKMTSAKFEKLFGTPRKPESEMAPRFQNIAASIQKVTEEIVLRMAQSLHAQTGSKNLCLAGGVALNCVANSRIARESPFENVWVQPAAGDAGGALGVAMLIWHQLLGNPRKVAGDPMQGGRLGPEFSSDEIQKRLVQHSLTFEHLANESELLPRVARLLANQKVVGWFQERMEFGPRALGSRSILADPRGVGMQDRVNAHVKNRESFRPFAPSVLDHRADKLFDLPRVDNAYMTFVGQRENSLPVEFDLPAVTHVDGSSRVQTVDARFGRFYRLLRSFERLTNCPVLLNTSFNVRGEPIVCRPEEAIQCFLKTGLDALVIGDFLIEK